MGNVRTETADTLRGFSTGEPTVVDGLFGVPTENVEDSGLDRRTHGLVRLAALIALGAPAAAYSGQVGVAREAGASPEEVLGVLVAVGPLAGMPRVLAAAPELMRALGVPGAS